MRHFILSIICIFSLSFFAFGQQGDDHQEDYGHPTQTEESSHDNLEDHGSDAAHTEGDHGAHACDCDHEEAYSPSVTAFHHIADANTFHIFGDIYLPLPCILYSPDNGWDVFMASKFHIHHHGNGELAINRYVLVHGEVMRVKDEAFPMGEVELDCVTHADEHAVVSYKGTCYELDKKSSFDGGMLGGGITSYYDLSITKNVTTMILVFLLLFFMFRSVAKAYRKREGKAPKGLQSLIEPVFTFIRDEVAIPFLGKKYERYLPYLMSIFFFILGLNLIGQIPFFPGSGNVTGNLAVTMVLAIITFFVVNLSGNKHYWEHILWMPGVPAWIKVILTPVEIMGMFIKPLTLMLRLFANITAGHVVIIIFVSLIFIFGDAGESLLGSTVGGVIAVPLTLFMMAIELLVAFIQAFVFCILAASYIGAAIEEHH